MPMKKRRITSSEENKTSFAQLLLLWVLLLACIVGAVALPVAINQAKRAQVGLNKLSYQVGTLSEKDLIAPETFYYLDEVATKELRQKAASAVLPRFSYSLSVSQQVVHTLDYLFETLSQNTPWSSSDLTLQQNFAVTLSEERQLMLHQVVKEIVIKVLEQGIYSQTEIDLLLTQGYETIQVFNLPQALEIDSFKTVMAYSVFTEETLAELIQNLIPTYGAQLEQSEQLLALDLAVAVITPNVRFDALQTALERKKAEENITPAMVKVEKGQYLLKHDFIITDRQVRAIKALNNTYRRHNTLQLLGIGLFVLSVTLLSYYLMQQLFANSFRRVLFTQLMFGGVFLTLIGIFLIRFWSAPLEIPLYDPLLPVLLVPVMLALVTGKKAAGYISAALLGAYAILLPDANFTTFFFIFGISIFGVHFVSYVSRRIEMLFQWFFGVVLTSALVIANNLVLGFGTDSLFLLMGASLVNITVTYLLVSALLPLIEVIFNVPTAFRLRELAYGDSPLLFRLSQNALGTYNHVQVVADMAYWAAKEIGADALLCRVGALYHDIGKLDNPEYFMENQSGDNKHDELRASLSVAIIKSHVRLGVEKGRAAGLPREVLDIISQHHGNDVIAWFLKEAQEEALATGKAEVSEEDYRYSASLPQTREAAIVMLADSVEAASRSLRKPSAQKYEKLIHQIVMGKIERRQLSSSNISLTDLDRITASFVRTLTGKHHTRLEYPEEQE